MAQERIWLMLDGNGSFIKAIDECEEELGRLDLDGGVMTAFPGMEAELARVGPSNAATLERRPDVWLEEFIEVAA